METFLRREKSIYSSTHGLSTRNHLESSQPAACHAAANKCNPSERIEPLAKQRQSLPLSWIEEVEPCPQLVFDDADKMLRIPARYLVGSGVKSPRTGTDLLLYRRAPLTEQWSKIQCHSLDSCTRLWIVGAPGTGKSSAAYAFACGKVDRTQWDVVWIRYTRKAIKLVQFQDDVKSTCAYSLHPDFMQEVTVELDSLLYDQYRDKKALVFLDGYVQKANACESLRTTLIQWQQSKPTRRRLVCVASLVSVLTTDVGSREDLSVPRSSPLPESSTAETPRIAPEVSEDFPSRVVDAEEYLDAIEHEDFYRQVCHKLDPTSVNQVKLPGTRTQLKYREEKVRGKYQVAGGSARFMFALSPDACIEVLDDAIHRAGDLKLVVEGHIGRFSSDTVHTLFACFLNPKKQTTEHRILSEYVARSLATRLGPELILQYAQLLNSNPAMDGHAMEAWFFSSAANGGLNYWPRSSSAQETLRWEDQDLVMFDPDASENQVVQGFLNDGWHAPKKWNQAGYDVVLTETSSDPSKKLRRVSFVQITRGRSHSFKPEPFVGLLRKLSTVKRALADVELVYAVPLELLDHFKVPVSPARFQMAVINTAFPSNRIQAKIRVVGVEYPMQTGSNRYPLTTVSPPTDKLDRLRVNRVRAPHSRQEGQQSANLAAKRKARQPPKSAPLPTSRKPRR